ncbi:MAG: phosphoribosylformylglycinamidine cyclo-ligase [Candidatus Aminicenantes bacterium]|nr:phosphoribosylformylglycinamidine cyclo-ligase [Candidatus Aminicenantes bacterium]
MATLTYRKAGVDIDEADRFIRRIKPMVRSTLRPEVLSGIGGFSGLVRPRLKGMRRPVLVSSTDGVGTKIMLADLLGKYDTVGIDLVAMNVDDVVVTGAEPLFFLDYIACGRVRTSLLAEVVKGIVKGCRTAGCALIGGETAELPGLYAPGRWDLAGFCVGIVDEDKIIDGRGVRPGDVLIGLASSGLHSNGFSLARKVFRERELRGEIGRRLLRPTRIYTPVLLRALRTLPVKAMAHITGGGFYDNIPRVLPEGRGVRVERGSWPIPDIFRVIQSRGGVEDREMFRTFNMGVGMAVVVDRRAERAAVRLFERLGYPAWPIGTVTAGRREVVLE